MTLLTDVHVFESRGRKLAFNGTTYKARLLSDGDYASLLQVLHGSPTVQDADLALSIVESLHTLDDAAHSSAELCPVDETTLPPVLSLCLLVTSRCNMSCSYCFNDAGGYGFATRHVMSVETARKAVDLLFSSCGPRRQVEISFFGGEPLTQFPLIKDVVAYAENTAEQQNIAIHFHVTTNGTLVTEEVARFLADHHFSVIVSIDGTEELHNRYRKLSNGKGTYDLAIRGAQTIISACGSQDALTIRGTYTHQQPTFYDSFMHLVARGFKTISIEPCTATQLGEFELAATDVVSLRAEYDKLATTYLDVQTKEPGVSFFHFDRFINNLRHFRKTNTPCGAANGTLTIAADGGIYPCHRIVNEEYKLGNLDDLLQGSEMDNHIRRAFGKATTHNRPTCQSCWARFLCGGTCYASSIEHGNGILEVDPVECKLMQLFIETSIGLMFEEIARDGDSEAGSMVLPLTLAEENIPANCRGCQSYCETSCQGACQKDCQTSCERSCQATCEKSCTQVCRASCQTSCERSCQAFCEMSCQYSNQRR